MMLQAMKQALEALEDFNEQSKPPLGVPLPAEIDMAMDALRTAIEQMEKAEPITPESELARMRHRIECLRGGLKSASGKFFEIGERGAAEDCLEWAGDMEPPLMGSNAEIRGGEAVPLD